MKTSIRNRPGIGTPLFAPGQSPCAITAFGEARGRVIRLIGRVRSAVQDGRMGRNTFQYFKKSPKVIRLAVRVHVRFPFSLWKVENRLRERGIDVRHESIRFWWNRIGPMFARMIRKKLVAGDVSTDQFLLASRRDVRRHQQGESLSLASGRS